MAETKAEHYDTGKRCQYHLPRTEAPCIRCSCGDLVRPEKWDAHVLLREPKR